MTQQPKKFVKKNGVNSVNPEYLAWKRSGGKNSPSLPWQDPIDKMMVQYQVLQAKDLVAKDRNMFGKRISSDPYVHVSLLCTPSSTVSGQKKKMQKIKLGRTPTMKKNLSPIWNYSQASAIPYSRRNEILQLMFEIFDEDKLSSDDSMGALKLQALQWKDSVGSAVWYEIPKGSAKDVSGKIQIKVSVSIHRVQGLRPYCWGQCGLVADLMNIKFRNIFHIKEATETNHNNINSGWEIIIDTSAVAHATILQKCFISDKLS